LIKAAIAIAMLCAAPVSPTGYVASEKFVVVIVACKADGECEEFRWPIDVSSILQCQRSAGAFTVARWGVSHPSYTLKSWRCAKADENDL
jgi:hypothetical protein